MYGLAQKLPLLFNKREIMLQDFLLPLAKVWSNLTGQTTSACVRACVDRHSTLPPWRDF